jgi:hypothetical protein
LVQESPSPLLGQEQAIIEPPNKSYLFFFLFPPQGIILKLKKANKKVAL